MEVDCGGVYRGVRLTVEGYIEGCRDGGGRRAKWVECRLSPAYSLAKCYL